VPSEAERGVRYEGRGQETHHTTHRLNCKPKPDHRSGKNAWALLMRILQKSSSGSMIRCPACADGGDTLLLSQPEPTNLGRE
jgi:hypothetical protein